MGTKGRIKLGKKSKLVEWAESLSCGAVNSKPVNVDWSEVFASDVDDANADYWESMECEKCGKRVAVNSGMGDITHREFDETSTCDGNVGLSEGPMMNCYYPIPIRDDVEAAICALKITTCLCVVRVGPQYGLALTGGGMDLSWEICQAFIECGYLPPTHFELPATAMSYTPKHQRTVSAMLRSLDCEAGWILRRKGRLVDTVKQIRGYERKWRA